jgi:hypothetical protein
MDYFLLNGFGGNKEAPVFSVLITTNGQYILRCDRVSQLVYSPSTFLTVNCDNGVRAKRPIRASDHISSFNNISILLVSIAQGENKLKDLKRLDTHDGYCHIRVENTNIHSYFYGGENYYAPFDYSLYEYNRLLYVNLKANYRIEPLFISNETKSLKENTKPVMIPTAAQNFYDWTDDDLNLTDRKLVQTINDVVGERLRLAEQLRQYVADNLGAQKLYLTMSTNPKRMKTLHYTLSTIDFSNIDTLFITLPFKYRNKFRYQISRKLAMKFNKIKFLSISSDIGPLAKIIPAVEYVKSVRGKLAEDDIFISIDDDNAYHTSMVNTLAYYSLIDKGSAFGASARKVKYWFMSPAGLPPYQNVKMPALSALTKRPIDILEGYAGVSYRGRHFDIELIKNLVYEDNRNEIFTMCYTSDDLVISYFLAYNNVQLNQIPVKTTDYYNVKNRMSFPHADDDFALHLVDSKGAKIIQTPYVYLNVEKYNSCYQQLVATFLSIQADKIEFKTRSQLIVS